MRLRWEGDERGEGVADAAPFARDADELVRMMQRPQWVAEDPEAHLLPHLERACESLPFTLVTATAADDGSFDVELEWTDDWRVGVVRAAVFALVGSISEPSTYVLQRDVEPGRIFFDVVTGFVDEHGAFAPHGHTLRIVVRHAG